MARQRSILAEALAWVLAATLLVGRSASAETLLAEAESSLDGMLPGEELVVRTIERFGEIVVEDAEEREGHVANSRGYIVLEIAPYGAAPLTQTVNAKLALVVEAASINGRDAHRRVVLEVGFDPSNGFIPTDRSVAIFEDSARLQATVTEIIVTDADGAAVIDSSVLERLTVKAAVEADHFYEPQPSEAPRSTSAELRVGGGAGDLRLSWEPIRWAESYDLEWTHVDDYSRQGLYAAESLPQAGTTTPNRHPVLARPPSALPYDFRSNRTRVSVDDTSYELPVTFERGYVLWRVRAVGRDPENPAQTVAGSWSSFLGDFGSGLSPSDSGVVHLDYNASHTAENVSHESGRAVRDENGRLLKATSKNWQHVATYAEGGRRSDLVRYLDGTLRERQVVTRRNSDGELLVGESIPDHRGRTAVEFLAVPVDREGGPRVPIRYERNLNLNDDRQPYTFRDFEVDLGDGPRASPAAPARGASQYFSPENRNQAGHQGYTPDALGFPFSHRLFTADDTGRVTAEGGPGPAHQIGTGHETRTYYGVADQSELDRLFGSDAGLVDHYKKQSTVDPDGQVTVSYLDPSGKIVASALAGNVPKGLEPLIPEILEPLAVTTVIDLLESDQQVSGGERLLSSSKTIFLADAGPVTVSYSAMPPLVDTAGCSGDGCYRCAYELDIRITDDSGRIVFPVGSDASDWPKYFGFDRDVATLCSEIPQPIEIDPIDLDLGRGAYRISKTLSVVEARLDAAARHFAHEARNSCLASDIEDIADALTDGTTPSECRESCRACNLEQIPQRVRLSDEEGGAWTELFTERRLDIGQSCQRSCSFDPVETPCEAGFQAILADVSPGGQYGITSSDPLSVFNEANDLPVNRVTDTIGNWRHPFTRYVDDDGSPSIVYLSGQDERSCRAPRSDGGCLPQDLDTVELFLEHWRPTWAEAVAPMHPEYGYYEFCQRQPDTVSFPQRLRAISRFSDAASWLSDESEAPVDLTSPEGLLAADPLFPARPAPEPERTRRFRDTLNDFSVNPGEGGSNLSLPSRLTIVETVHLVAGECNNSLFDDAEARACASAAGAIGGTPGNEDNEWRYLRDLYLSRRADVLYAARSNFIGESPLYFSNRCIGDPTGTGCGSYISAERYGEKVKIFPENRDALDLVPDDDFEIVRDWNERRLYERCGLCGLHTELEALLSGAARRGLLVASSTIPRFPVIPGPRLVEAFSRVGGLTVSLPVDDQYTWSVNVAGDALDIDINANVEFPIWTGGSEVRNVRVGQLRLRKPSGSAAWGDVRWFHGLSPLVIADPELFDGSGNSFFSIRGMLAETCTTTLESGCFVEVEGEAVGFDLSSCDLPRLCTGSEAADQMAAFAGYLFSDIRRRALSGSFFRIPDDDDILGSLIRAFGSDALEQEFYWRFRDWGSEGSALGRSAFTAELRRGSTGIEFFDQCTVWFETSRPLQEDETSLTVIGPKGTFRESEDLTRVVLADRHEERGNGPQCDSPIVALDAVDEDGKPLEIQIGSSCHTFSNCCVDPATCPSTDETPRVEGPLLQGDNLIFGERPPVLNLPDNLLALLNPARLENLPACNTCSYPIEPAIPYPNTCPAQEKQVIETAVERAKDEHRDDTRRRFRNDMLSQCLAVEETFTATYEERTYHFTLLYYDQAGNLIRTVPPKGVELLSPNEIDRVACHRLTQDDDPTNDCGGPPADPVYPAHTMATTYAYSSLNQVTEKTTPDSGTTRYWYDRLGRVVASQDANQAEAGDLYGYVAYDELGRVCEAGEVQTDAAPDTITAKCENGEVTGIPLEARNEYTRTYYDRPMNTTVDGYFNGGQQNLRNRVASAERIRHDPDGFTWQHRTHFSYDIHGNIATLIQENPLMPEGHRVKRIDYDYDQISGKINRMTYQRGADDQFIHRYEYDADNRLERVFTSTDGVLWDRDAEYTYYAHGPLARVELGEHRVQGIDYAYTIHGWLKGINSDTLVPSRDIGKDGIDAPSPGGSHREVATDAFGMSLGYYDGDYRPISGLPVPDMFAADVVGEAFEGREDLYNGDISHLVYAYPGVDGTPDIWAEQMAYDQFGRLREVSEVRGADVDINSWVPGQPSSEPRASYTYDANGNLLTLKRRNSAGILFDDLTYRYYTLPLATNRLAYISDAAGQLVSDLPDQATPACAAPFSQLNCNYGYDARGQLIQDRSSVWRNFEWTATGRIGSADGPTGKFRTLHGAFGNTVFEISGSLYSSLIRDLEGHLLARGLANGNRVGGPNFTVRGNSNHGEYVSEAGTRRYYLPNHVDSLAVTIGSSKVVENTSRSLAYAPKILTKSHYYPFGSGEFGGNPSPFGFQGMEAWVLHGEAEIYRTRHRVFDPRIARWISPDPKQNTQPSVSSYIGHGNNPIAFLDPDGSQQRDDVLLYRHQLIRSQESVTTADDREALMGVIDAASLALDDLQLTGRAVLESLGFIDSRQARIELGRGFYEAVLAAFHYKQTIQDVRSYWESSRPRDRVRVSTQLTAASVGLAFSIRQAGRVLRTARGRHIGSTLDDLDISPARWNPRQVRDGNCVNCVGSYLEELQSGGFTRSADELPEYGGASSGRTRFAMRHLERIVEVEIAPERIFNDIPNADGHYIIFQNPNTALGHRVADHVLVATRRGEDVVFFDPQLGAEVPRPDRFDAHAVNLWPGE